MRGSLRVRGLLAALVCALATCAAGEERGARDDRILPLDVTVNGARGGTWVFVERDGMLHAPRDAFEEWRVELSKEAQGIDFRGETYYPLSAVQGYRSRVDFPTQSLELTFSPEAFASLRLSRKLASAPTPDPVLPGAFLNYDINYAASAFRGAASVQDLGVLAEAGLGTPFGVFTSRQIVRHGSRALVGGSRTFLRLETTFTRDYPERNHTLRLGDSATRAGLWGRSVHFGGVQYGTNWALTPGITTRPLPTLRGLSAAPSTVELFVNDVLRQVSDVPTGPFAIDNFPVVAGSGEVRLVVRDVLGRETVIVQPFFAATELLAPPLNDWSVAAGMVREELGAASDRYGEAFVNALWRRGVSPRVTAEGRVEAARHQQAVGGGVVAGLPWQVLGSFALAASRARGRGTGASWYVGLERNVARTSLGIQAQGGTRDFRLLGQEAGFPGTRAQVAGNLTWYSERFGTLGVGYASIARYGEPRITTLSANYSLSLPGRSSLNVVASEALEGATGRSVGVTFVLPLDGGRTATASATSRDGVLDFYAAASQAPAVESGWGWRALAGRQQGSARLETGAYRLGERGLLSGELSYSPERRAVRLGASGGVVVAGGTYFVTRRIDQSYALVEVEGYPDVGVGIGGRMLARTDDEGLALLPNLLPYQRNAVRLDPRDLPLAAELDSIEATAVPSFRSGVRVRYPVRGGRGALLRIVLDDGEPAPAGAQVELLRDGERFYVARRGEAFVTGMLDTNRLQLHWQGRSCEFEVSLPPADRDEILRLGPFTCAGLAR